MKYFLLKATKPGPVHSTQLGGPKSTVTPSHTNMHEPLLHPGTATLSTPASTLTAQSTVSKTGLNADFGKPPYDHLFDLSAL